jgi:squalene cyclase
MAPTAKLERKSGAKQSHGSDAIGYQQVGQDDANDTSNALEGAEYADADADASAGYGLTVLVILLLSSNLRLYLAYHFRVTTTVSRGVLGNRTILDVHNDVH